MASKKRISLRSNYETFASILKRKSIGAIKKPAIDSASKGVTSKIPTNGTPVKTTRHKSSQIKSSAASGRKVNCTPTTPTNPVLSGRKNKYCKTCCSDHKNTGEVEKVCDKSGDGGENNATFTLQMETFQSSPLPVIDENVEFGVIEEMLFEAANLPLSNQSCAEQVLFGDIQSVNATTIVNGFLGSEHQRIDDGFVAEKIVSTPFYVGYNELEFKYLDKHGTNRSKRFDDEFKTSLQALELIHEAVENLYTIRTKLSDINSFL